MDTHKNARLTPKGREQMVHAVVDGGMTRNRWLMQFQSDLLGIPVETAREPEQTALGAALLALGERRPSPAGELFEPGRSRESEYAGWRAALRRTL